MVHKEFLKYKYHATNKKVQFMHCGGLNLFLGVWWQEGDK
jgi:hypothetical protein